MNFLSRWWGRRRRPLDVDLDTPSVAPVPAVESASRVLLSLRASNYTDPTDVRTLLWTTVTATLTGSPMGFRVAVPGEQLPAAPGAPLELWLQLQLRPELVESDATPYDREDRHDHWPAADDPFTRAARSVEQLNPIGAWTPQAAAWLEHVPDHLADQLALDLDDGPPVQDGAPELEEATSDGRS